MVNSQVFEYLIIFNPTPEQEKEGKKPEILVDLKRIIAKNIEAASMSAAMDIPVDKKGELDQIQIVLRPF